MSYTKNRNWLEIIKFLHTTGLHVFYYKAGGWAFVRWKETRIKIVATQSFDEAVASVQKLKNQYGIA